MRKRYVPLFEEYSQDEENNGVRTYIDFDKQNERSRELNKPKEKKGSDAKSALELFIKNAIDAFNDGYNGCYYYNLGKGSNGKEFAIVIGWSEGFDEEDDCEGCISDGEYRVCMKLAYNCDDLQCDYDIDWEMPGGEDGGDVDDTNTEITTDVDEVLSMAQGLINVFEERWS